MSSQGSHDQCGRSGYNGISLPQRITDASSFSLRGAFQRCNSATRLLPSNKLCSLTLSMNLYLCIAALHIKGVTRATVELLRRSPLQGLPMSSDTARQGKGQCKKRVFKVLIRLPLFLSASNVPQFVLIALITSPVPQPPARIW